MNYSPRLAVALLITLTTSVAVACSLPWSRKAATPAESQSTSHTDAESNSAQPTTTDAAPPDGWTVVGTSVQGRPIRVRSVGSGPRKVLFIGGIHGDEPEGAYSTDALPAAFEGAGLATTVTLTILENANPDGRAAGTRHNANGVDVNRNFPASNFDAANPAGGGTPLNQPESRAVNDTIERLGPNLVLVAHSWTGRQFVNFDGPARDVAERFSATSGLPVEESSSFAVTPGSLGSYFGRDRGTPVVTIEFLKGSDPQADWETVREALLQAIGGG